MDESVKVILADAFEKHPNIVELICHDKVGKIESCAFAGCVKLRRVVMPGVKLAGIGAFRGCSALADVECGKLERIEGLAFGQCKSLRSIYLPSIKIFERGAFWGCHRLGRITIPLKDGLIAGDDIFQECRNLKQVDLIEGELHESIAALQLENWKNDMNEEIDSISQTLPNIDAGFFDIYTFHGDTLERRPWRFEGGLDRFLTKLFTTKQSIATYWTRLVLHFSSFCLKKL